MALASRAVSRGRATGEPTQQRLSLFAVLGRRVDRSLVEHLEKLQLSFTRPLTLDEPADESSLVLATSSATLQPSVGITGDANADLTVPGGGWHSDLLTFKMIPSRRSRSNPGPSQPERTPRVLALAATPSS